MFKNGKNNTVIFMLVHKMALQSFTAAYGEGEVRVWVKGMKEIIHHVRFSIFKCETPNALSL